MSLRLKRGVSLTDAKLAIGVAMGVVLAIHKEMGLPAPTITSVNDGQHMNKSRHYTGEAFDLRVFDLTQAQRVERCKKMREILDPLGFDVISSETIGHVDHDHLEFDAKPGEQLFSVL